MCCCTICTRKIVNFNSPSRFINYLPIAPLNSYLLSCDIEETHHLNSASNSLSFTLYLMTLSASHKFDRIAICLLDRLQHTAEAEAKAAAVEAKCVEAMCKILMTFDVDGDGGGGILFQFSMCVLSMGNFNHYFHLRLSPTFSPFEMNSKLTFEVDQESTLSLTPQISLPVYFVV